MPAPQLFLKSEAEMVRQAAVSAGEPMFRIFPHGCCGPAAELLARHLRQHWSLDAQYVTGRQELQGHSWTHAWALIDGWIIDITSDQFPEIAAPVVVTPAEDSPWHALWVSDEAPRAPITSLELWPDYPSLAWEAIEAAHTSRRQ
jgi:hypothetical protein